PLFVCGGTDLILDGNPSDGSGNYVSHMWSGQVGSLDNITIQTPTFNTTFTGAYALTYTVTDDNGCMGTDNVTINVDSPRALFSMDSNTGCDLVVVNFTNNSIGADTYTWNFGDGSPEDNSVNPTHTFDNLTTTIQYFNVKLIAESAGGCIDSVMQVVTVYPTVEAAFTITPDTICHGDAPVQLAAQPGGSAYHWDFGDGNSGYAGNVTTHSFTNITENIITRTVTLTTESFYGCTDVATRDIVIYPAPVPEFSPNPASQTWPNNQVQFINQTNAGTWTYLWNFGDGNTSAEFEPTHTYGVPGTYMVTLEVSNDRCSGTVSHNVEILPIMPIASFADVSPECSPYTVQFVNTSQNATSYFWDFGDGSSSNEENPEHTYYRGGSFIVRLTAIGPGGQDKYQQMVEVYQSPTAMLDVSPTTVYVNDKAVKCFNLSSYGDTYLWEFGDGETDTIYEPYHVYMEEGIYDITLHVYSENGCEDVYTLSPAVTVLPAGVLRYPTAFKPNKTGPTGGGVPGDPNLINTVFFPPIQQQIDDYHLQIFNRWGEKLFESTDINIGWDGYYKGTLCKQDVYVWQVKGRFNNGKPYRQAGDITLLH
ncbi:MAG: PKD domain-containing protein, partial [Bacteroidota bacterium]|nr:PKD domain-containing protein [Bacteroidota bacterium]